MKLKKLYNSVPAFLKNKYLLVSFLFSIWIVFLDENNLIVLKNQLDILKKNQADINQIQLENIQIEEKLRRLSTDSEELEKFARENFLMKQENEDIIIIRKRSNE